MTCMRHKDGSQAPENIEDIQKFSSLVKKFFGKKITNPQGNFGCLLGVTKVSPLKIQNLFLGSVPIWKNKT